MQTPPTGSGASVSRDRLPAGVALGYVGIIACRIGAIVPGLTGVSRAVVVIAVIRVAIPSVSIRIVTQSQPVTPPPAIASIMPAVLPVTPAAVTETIALTGDTAVNSTAVKSTAVKSAAMESTAVKSTAVKSAAMESTAVKSIAVEPAPALEPAAPAIAPSIGEIWLAERGSAQQSSCKDSGGYTYPVPWFVLT
jgi:hypothetical protein